MVSPFAPVHGSSPAIVFHLHSPLSHRLLHHTANRAITRMVSTSAAKIYLENLDYKDVLFQKNTSWDLCSQDGQIHLGEIFNEDIEILLGPPSSSSVDSIKSIHRTKDGIINHRNHSITNPNKSVPLLQSPEYIFCMCTKDDSLFWIAGRKLYTPQSTHGHVLPPPLKDPVAMMLFKEEILIADRKGLWIFHRSQERFARYVGREGATVQDGLFPQAVFQNITTMSVYGIYIFVADAHNLRCINTQEGVVQTLNINIAPSYLSTIVVHKNNIFLSDFVQNKIWRYNLEHESAHQRRHDAPKDMMILDETMMILSGNSLTQHSIKGSWELVL
jgi:hypothetical protein